LAEESENPKEKSHLGMYIWMLVQSAVVMKIVILYFGQKMAAEEDSASLPYFLVALIFSFSSLLWFAWRQHRREQE
jgi:hypothetical protein